MKIKNIKSIMAKVDVSRSLTVAFLLSVISFTYITNVSCVCDMNGSDSNLQMAFDSHDHDHSDHHSSNHHHSEEMNMKGHQHPTDSQDDGCCSDNNTCTCDQAIFTLLSDLPKLVLASTNLKIKDFISSDIVSDELFVTQDYLYQQRPPGTNTYLPPKIRDIRIFIQSYLI